MVEYKTRFCNYRQLYLTPFWAHIEASRWRLLSDGTATTTSLSLTCSPVYISENGASRREILKPRAGGNPLIIKSVAGGAIALILSVYGVMKENWAFTLFIKEGKCNFLFDDFRCVCKHQRKKHYNARLIKHKRR